MTCYRVDIDIVNGEFHVANARDAELLLHQLGGTSCSVHLVNEKGEPYHNIVDRQPGILAAARFREWHDERIYRKWQLREDDPIERLRTIMTGIYKRFVMASCGAILEIKATIEHETGLEVESASIDDDGILRVRLLVKPGDPDHEAMLDYALSVSDGNPANMEAV